MKPQNFCQLLSRPVTGPVQRRGWGLVGTIKRSLAQSPPGQQQQALPQAPQGQEGPGGQASQTPPPGHPRPPPHPAPPTPTSHSGPGARGAGLGSRGHRRRRLTQIWPRPGPGAQPARLLFPAGKRRASRGGPRSAGTAAPPPSPRPPRHHNKRPRRAGPRAPPSAPGPRPGPGWEWAAAQSSRARDRRGWARARPPAGPAWARGGAGALTWTAGGRAGGRTDASRADPGRPAVGRRRPGRSGSGAGMDSGPGETDRERKGGGGGGGGGRGGKRREGARAGGGARQAAGRRRKEEARKRARTRLPRVTWDRPGEAQARGPAGGTQEQKPRPHTAPDSSPRPWPPLSPGQSDSLSSQPIHFLCPSPRPRLMHQGSTHFLPRAMLPAQVHFRI
jgi:hypothetical protein